MSSDLPESEASVLEVISTFLDGERVEPAALKCALELAEGRDYLLDLLTIRAAIGGMGAFALTLRKPSPKWTLVRRTAAAAVVLLALAGGYAAGLRRNVPVETPRATAEPRVIPVTSPAEAPKPTRVIKLEPGVNWSDSTGGK